MASAALAHARRRYARPVALTNRNVAQFRRALLGWYKLHRRDLPWRKTRDPYQIWVSEIMLQQTRVAAVLQHYREFIERFPSVNALASASEDEVLSAWSGLGYYRRARMLLQGAVEVAHKQAGQLPASYARLLELPGIGRYTAAAIASIAFSEPVAVVDGNVERVAERIEGRELSIRETWDWAQKALEEKTPGDFNQAVMELGATICTPRSPTCSDCPVQKWCATKGERPRPSRQPVQKKREIWCSLEERAGAISTNGNPAATAIREIRLIRRPRTSPLMPGMWELPSSSEQPTMCLPSMRWRTFRHCITVTNYTVHVLRYPAIHKRQARFFKPRGEWINIDKIRAMPITGLTRKILKAGGII